MIQPRSASIPGQWLSSVWGYFLHHFKTLPRICLAYRCNRKTHSIKCSELREKDLRSSIKWIHADLLVLVMWMILKHRMATGSLNSFHAQYLSWNNYTNTREVLICQANLSSTIIHHKSMRWSDIVLSLTGHCSHSQLPPLQETLQRKTVWPHDPTGTFWRTCQTIYVVSQLRSLPSRDKVETHTWQSPVNPIQAEWSSYGRNTRQTRLVS